MAKLTSETSETCDQRTSRDSSNAISSPALVDGLPLFNSLVGTTLAASGQVRALVNHSRPRGKAMAPTIPAIFGLRGSSSSRSAVLQQSLASRLRQSMDLHGSTGFRLIWKERVTPSRRRICQLRALPRHINDNACGSWPTPTRSDCAGRMGHALQLTSHGTYRHTNRAGVQSTTRVGQVCNRVGRPDLAASVAFRLQLMGYRLPQWRDAMPQVMPSSRKSRKPSSKRI